MNSMEENYELIGMLESKRKHLVHLIVVGGTDPMAAAEEEVQDVVDLVPDLIPALLLAAVVLTLVQRLLLDDETQENAVDLLHPRETVHLLHVIAKHHLFPALLRLHHRLLVMKEMTFHQKKNEAVALVPKKQVQKESKQIKSRLSEYNGTQ